MVDSLNKKIAVGYLWNLLTKWLNRSIGVISTLILIRLLEPADFGIAALASIVMTFFVMLSDVGTEKYVIRANSCSDELLDSAWSLNIALKTVCGLVIALLAGVIADFIHEPVLSNVLLVCSLIPVVGSLKNIGLVEYERKLDYQPLTRLSVSVKITVFPVIITLAFWWQSYWALIIGVLFSELLTVVGSYWLHSYRPRWSVKHWRQQWSFSQWFLVSTTSGFIRSRIDALLLGRFLPSDAVGTYRVSQEFAWLPFSELIAPATSSMYAGFAKIRHNRDEINEGIIKYLTVAYLLVVPSTFGIFALNEQIVSVVMGAQWQAAAPVLGLLSLLMLSMPLNMALQTALINLAKVKYLVILDVIMIVAIVLSFASLYQSNVQDLVVYTYVRVVLMVLFIVLLMVTYKVILSVSMARLLTVFLLPMLPALLMFVVVESLEQELKYSEPVNLVILIAIGASIFIPMMMVLIVLTKRILPDYEFLFSIIRRITVSAHRKLIR